MNKQLKFNEIEIGLEFCITHFRPYILRSGGVTEMWYFRVVDDPITIDTDTDPDVINISVQKIKDGHDYEDPFDIEVIDDHGYAYAFSSFFGVDTDDLIKLYEIPEGEQLILQGDNEGDNEAEIFIPSSRKELDNKIGDIPVANQIAGRKRKTRKHKKRKLRYTKSKRKLKHRKSKRKKSHKGI